MKSTIDAIAKQIIAAEIFRANASVPSFATCTTRREKTKKKGRKIRINFPLKDDPFQRRKHVAEEDSHSEETKFGPSSASDLYLDIGIGGTDVPRSN